MTGSTEMRLKEIHRRTKIKKERYENQILSILMTLNLVLFTGIVSLTGYMQMLGISDVVDNCSAVLLQNDAEAYVIDGIASFAAGMALTIIGIRHKKKKSDEMKAAQGSDQTP